MQRRRTYSQSSIFFADKTLVRARVVRVGVFSFDTDNEKS